MGDRLLKYSVSWAVLCVIGEWAHPAGSHRLRRSETVEAACRTAVVDRTEVAAELMLVSHRIESCYSRKHRRIDPGYVSVGGQIVVKVRRRINLSSVVEVRRGRESVGRTMKGRATAGGKKSSGPFEGDESNKALRNRGCVNVHAA